MPSPRFGYFSRLLEDATPAERYEYVTREIQHAEQLGFDSAWVAQHHFHHLEGGLPSPLVFLAHLAAKTSRIRLGTGVITLPLENVVRTVEDAIVADILSGGRLEIGLGSGSTPGSFLAFGRDPEQRRAIYEEALAELRSVLAGEAIRSEGNRLYPADTGISERIWQATFSANGGRVAGENGHGLLLSRTQPRSPEAPEAALSDLQIPIIEAYLSALPTGVAPRIAASRTVFVSDTRADALFWAEQGIAAARKNSRAFQFHVDVQDVEHLIRLSDTHTGTAEQVTESLQADATLQYATDVLIQIHSVDAPHPKILRSLELFSEQVAPHIEAGQLLDQHSPNAQHTPNAKALS